MSTTVPARDRARQVTVTAAEIFCVVGTLVGVGVLGTRVAESSGGVLAADATLLAPAGPAFSIWSVIYAGLAAYTVWQWLPRVATSPRARSTGWLAALSMVLNAAWLLVTQQGWIWLSVGIIIALAATLALLVARLGRHPARDTVELVLVDGTFGLYLGWVTAAGFANIAAALDASGIDVGPIAAVAGLALAATAGVVLASRLGARWPVAVALVWALAWIVVGRATDRPESATTAVAAAVAALVVVAATVRFRVRTAAA